MHQHNNFMLNQCKLNGQIIYIYNLHSIYQVMFFNLPYYLLNIQFKIKYDFHNLQSILFIFHSLNGFEAHIFGFSCFAMHMVNIIKWL